MSLQYWLQDNIKVLIELSSEGESNIVFTYLIFTSNSVVINISFADYIPRMFIPLEPTFGERCKHGKVTGIHPSDKKVTLESGEEVSYDILVLATGTTGNFPNKLKPDISKSTDQMKDEYRTIYEKVYYIFTIILVVNYTICCNHKLVIIMMMIMMMVVIMRWWWWWWQ